MTLLIGTKYQIFLQKVSGLQFHIEQKKADVIRSFFFICFALHICCSALLWLVASLQRRRQDTSSPIHRWFSLAGGFVTTQVSCQLEQQLMPFIEFREAFCVLAQDSIFLPQKLGRRESNMTRSRNCIIVVDDVKQKFRHCVSLVSLCVKQEIWGRGSLLNDESGHSFC